MRITTAGNVGIGTNSPDTTTLLTVAGAMTLTGANSGHGASRLKLGQDTSAISQLRFYGADNSTPGILQFTGSSADGNIGGERMRITSAGQVLVGTTSAITTANLEVAAPSGWISTFRTNDATAGNNVGGGFYGTSSATPSARDVYFWLDADGANFTGTDYFYIQKSGNSGSTNLIQASNAPMIFSTNAIERMRISSVGYVTTPYQPAFMAYRTAGAVSGTGVFICNVTTFNDGSHFNTSTGKFTAPVAGKYQVNFFVLAQNPNNFDMNIYVNNAQYASMDIRCNANAVNNNFTLSVSAVINLSANDTVNPQVTSQPSGSIYGSGLNGFSMYFLG
jgi:hypothetical protein